ncbi:MAG: hybrid sensor histidine kinase/response regulator [Planctomycetota bacterium]|jgi:signal transduction histidine kinase/ActR/RegA family two-component response regulator
MISDYLNEQHWKNCFENSAAPAVIHKSSGEIIAVNCMAREFNSEISEKRNLYDFCEEDISGQIKENSDSPEHERQFKTRLFTETSSREVKFFCSVIDSKNDILLSIFAGVEEEKSIEQDLIRSERLAAVSTFATGIAHEFNNIHTSITGFLHLVLDNETLTDSVREKLEYALISSNRAAEVTRRLVAFTSRDNSELERKEIVLQDVINYAIDMVKAEYEEGEVDFKINIGATVNLLAYKEQMIQAVSGLLVNACHATLGRKERIVEVSTGIKMGRAFIKVVDNGCGIPGDEITRIFTPFFTRKGEHAEGDAPMSRVKGVGLGLSICQTIVENHNGEIKVKSEDGKSSDFTIYIPIEASVPQALQDEDQYEISSIEGIKVLVLDDEEMILNIVSQILGYEKCLVTAADNGRLALEMLQKTDFDIVLVDLQMPGMSGVEFMKEMDKMNLKNPPAKIVFTGKVTQQYRREFEDLDVSTTLHKPFGWENLYSAIVKALAHRVDKDK